MLVCPGRVKKSPGVDFCYGDLRLSSVRCWHRLPVICYVLSYAYSNMHMKRQQCTCSLSSFVHQLAHTHIRPAASHSLVKDVSPKINKPVLKSCNSIKLILIISTWRFCGLEIFAFYSPLFYNALPRCMHSQALCGGQVCACVRARACCDQIGICVLYSAGSGRQAHSVWRFFPCLKETKPLLCARRSLQRIWTHKKQFKRAYL